jgi:type 1 glutamine amidotransferase
MKSTLQALVIAALAAPLVSGIAAEPKKVIVCTVTTGFRHGSIPFAEKTLEKLAAESKAYTIEEFVRQPDIQVPRKPNKPKDLAPDADEKAKQRHANDMKKFDAEMAKWTPEVDQKAKESQKNFDDAVKVALQPLSPANLKAKKIDAVIFANTTGDLPLPDKEGFVKWVQDGHAFIGMHSASDTFHQFDGYKQMIQAEFKTLGRQVPADLIAGDTEHPANAGIGPKWDIAQEEMYEFKDGSHDRTKVHEIWFLRHLPQEPSNPGYNAVSWCRMDGKGRVFYTSLGHREDLWSDDPNMSGRVNSPETSKQYQAHILGGIKWALGLAKGSAEPNPSVK